MPDTDHVCWPRPGEAYCFVCGKRITGATAVPHYVPKPSKFEIEQLQDPVAYLEESDDA